MLNAALRFLAATSRLEIAWLALWLATTSFVQRTAAESLGGALDATHLQRVGFVAVAIVLLLSDVRAVRAPRLEPLALFLTYATIALASAAWSAGAVATIGKAGELFTAVLVVWQTLAKPDAPRRLLRLLDIALAFHGVLLVIALGGFVVAPALFSEPSTGALPIQLAAPYMSSNGVAAVGATIAIVCAARFLMIRPGDPRRLGYGLALGVFALFPFLAQGRTGLAILAVGVSLLMLRRRLSLATLIVFPALGAVGVLLLTEIADFVMRGQNQFQVESLSGRLVLWETALDSIAAHPWAGVGFGVGSRTVFAGTDLIGFSDTISSVHNGALEVLLGLGLIGFVVWLPAVLWAMVLCARAFGAGRELDIAILAVPWLGRTVMSTGLGGWLDLTIGTFLVGAAYLALMGRALRRRAASRPADGILMPRRA